MTKTEEEPIIFSKKVDENGRIAVPQDILQALQIEGARGSCRI
jgi:bifunctional DNA-binding transcriptional regulator/antitoxin component of YhaV-PrlF toxin-antitoxin module